MKTALQLALARVAPSVSIVTLWEHDPVARFSKLTGPGCCFENEDPDDWTPWQSEIRATAILEGEEITGSDYLGGTWEKAGDNPAESNPEISGYENQMTVDALCELMDQIRPIPNHPLRVEIQTAIDLCQSIAAEDYARQRAEIEASRESSAIA